MNLLAELGKFVPMKSEEPDPWNQDRNVLRSPYPTVEFGARCVQDLVDEYYQECCYVWVEIVECGKGERGPTELLFDFVDLRSAWAGDPPGWFSYLLENDNLEGLLEIPYHEEHGILTWSIEQGVHPGQPFLVVFEELRCSSYWTDYGYEYDEEFEWWIVRNMPTTWGPREYERMIADQMRDPT